MESLGWRGILYKKAGGKAMDKKTRLVERWHKRWFVLPPSATTLTYYKSEEEQMNGGAALGAVEVGGATIFLKEVKRGQYRFTVQSHMRELKLRAATAEDYEKWIAVLQPIASAVRDEDEVGGMDNLSMRDRGETMCDGDDDFDADEDTDIYADDSPGHAGGSSSSLAGIPETDFKGFGIADDARGGGSSLPTAGMAGLLDKKSGGKAGKGVRS